MGSLASLSREGRGRVVIGSDGLFDHIESFAGGIDTAGLPLPSVNTAGQIDRVCKDIDELLADKEQNQAALASSAAALELAEANTSGQAAAAARELSNLKRVALELRSENALLKRRATAPSGEQLPSGHTSQLQRLQFEERANRLRISALSNEISKLNSHNQALKQIRLERGGGPGNSGHAVQGRAGHFEI